MEEKLVKRTKDVLEVKKLQSTFPVVAILGARQCGKTTLAKQFNFDHYFDLENPRDLARLENPQLTLENLHGLIIIDEIQRAPELFPLLRFLIDTTPNQQYLILGSASQNLVKQSSESLAGRIGYYFLGGFSLHDVGAEETHKLWLRGGFPRSFLASSDDKSWLWRQNYILTFLERDIPQLGIQIPSRTLHRFWRMLCHYHGQVLNYAELGRSFGISDMTIRRYIEILEGTFIVRVLLPWHANLKKRLIKKPKIYIRDSGLFHSLMSIETETQLQAHPKLGASWEGFALECVAQHFHGTYQPIYFWGTHNGAEIDLFWQQGGKNWGIEFKYMDAPRRTKSMQIAVQDLDLAHLWIVYPGRETYLLDKRISVLPLQSFAEEVPPFPDAAKNNRNHPAI